MKRSTIEYCKEVIKRAENANRIASQARANYERDCVLAKNALEADLYGQKGYEDKLKELEAERDAQIENSLSGILSVVSEYDSEMRELGRLDGSSVDSDAVRLLDSGIQMNVEEWQAMADEFKDNHTMTRILQSRYSSLKKPGEILPSIRFGQSPADRSKVFGKFVRTIYHACESGACPALSGIGRLKTVTDFYNFIARDSLADMQPYGDESFDNLDKDFPVETENGMVENAGNKSSDFSSADFNFGFTPIR